MKEEKLLDAIGMVGDDLVEKAKPENIKSNAKKRKRKIIYSAVAAVLVVTLIVGAINAVNKSTVELYADVICKAEYPEVQKGDAQESARWELQKEYLNMDIDISSFMEKTIGEFLDEGNGENRLYSPLCAYMALGMLVELTNGSSREQILDLLGYEEVETLRKEANMLWNSVYIDDEDTKCLLASSAWIDEKMNFKQKPFETLSETYYASSYYVNMQSDDFNKAMKAWINKETGDLLKEQVDNMELVPNAALVLLSTLQFEAKWSEEFDKDNNETRTFYGEHGDESCEFMYTSLLTDCDMGEKFTAIRQLFKNDGGSMYYILPNEGVSVEELLSDKEALSYMASPKSWENSEGVKANLWVPKFDITSELNLIEDLKKLGVTDIFGFDTSDFSPVTNEKNSLEVGSVKQSSRVAIDEEGCIAASYVEIQLSTKGEAPVEKVIDFVLDRPFIFVITSEFGVPMFVGVVNHIN